MGKSRSICKPGYKAFNEAMNISEKKSWISFRNVTEKLLGKNKDLNYKAIVGTVLQKF